MLGSVVHQLYLGLFVCFVIILGPFACLFVRSKILQDFTGIKMMFKKKIQLNVKSIAVHEYCFL